MARLIQNHHTAINLGWAAFSPVLIYWMTRGQSPVQFRSLGYAWAGLLFLPSLVMFFLIRFFPLYRITDCPYCGHYELKKLGKSHSA
ncbi:MAG: hypothetical protein MUF31_07290 [Akkermansiaceae bacterium]|nr:hypothetical protein [Akkermansiaceae bacterium]